MPKEIVNRKARHEYSFLQEFEAGIQLLGPEVKSIKAGNANLRDAYCLIKKGELYIKSLYIAPYEQAHIDIETRRDRKLLLRKSEIRKIEKKAKEKGYTIVPLRIYFNDRGFIKVAIALAQGKTSYDKRHSIKDKDTRREMERVKKLRL